MPAPKMPQEVVLAAGRRQEEGQQRWTPLLLPGMKQQTVAEAVPLVEAVVAAAVVEPPCYYVVLLFLLELTTTSTFRKVLPSVALCSCSLLLFAFLALSGPTHDDDARIVTSSPMVQCCCSIVRSPHCIASSLFQLKAMKSQACCLCALSLHVAATATSGFVRPDGTRPAPRRIRVAPTMKAEQTESSSSSSSEECNLNNSGICSQFKILTCTSKACSQKRQVLQIDQYATFAALYQRKEEAGDPYSLVDVEESPCLGRCKLAPCVAVEHEDFVGTVGLIGMTDSELNDRVFHR